MSKVLTFSTVFPSYHPLKGQQTYFKEKILKSIDKDYIDTIGIQPKHHTIREGNRFEKGEYFSPRIWSGKPYCSKQIIIHSDIKIRRIYNIGLRIRGDFKEFYCNDEDLTSTSISLIAKNDGLLLNDFLNWFNKPFEGQIICWDNSIKY